ncbi:hypothetical protein [Alkaliphilus peptidifermentans]|uniref:Uncharacterized protein n=1 Tax=Alkaliphilus peptidifermentans DSM 18978 TaxID=1120976 RepID=A0A1G5ICJ4_9FIRM|nr:hypothetical protein [Alkaliphilus peptidifermentans]SCY73865.1 hypothetical protein SAMN03080606_02347 [Alkaliphilus peptidifermentans DSM 18978]
MEMLSWMKKVDGDMSKMDLLNIIDNMHEVINALLEKNNENEEFIKELKEILNQK